MKKKKMKKKKTPLEKRKSRLAEEIVKWYEEKHKVKTTFGELLDEYAITGESTDTVAKKFKKITNDEIKILRSTFGYAVRLYIDQKKTKYRIKGMKAGNQYRAEGTGLYRKGKNKKEESGQEAFFFCKNCNAEYPFKLRMKDGFANIQAIKCKKCGIYGTGRVLFKKDQKLTCIEIGIEDGGFIEEEIEIPSEQFKKKETAK